jgi:TetR/AcrR family transcriptional repressor of nem operon
MHTHATVRRKSPVSDTRHKLIDAAHTLIWANSYGHVSVEDICRAAGVQKGSFYHFFPTKNDLAAAALEDHWNTVRPRLDEIFAEHLSPQQQLRALCNEVRQKQEWALQETGKVCGCPYATVGAELSSSNEALRALSQRMSDNFQSYFEKLLTHAALEGLIEKRNLTQRAHEMHIYVIGAMMQARLTNSLESVGKSLENALARISGITLASKSSVQKKRGD